MAQQARVPKFGNWEDDDNVSYTQFFDNARKGTGGGRMVSPNDPMENPEAFSMDKPSVRHPVVTDASDLEAPKNRHERYRRQEVDPHHHDAVARNPYADSPKYQFAADQQRKGRRTNSGTDYIIDARSPLHPNSYVGAASKVEAPSPYWEQKGSRESNPGPFASSEGRSRGKAGQRGNETPERGSAMPKFGEWDERNPASADGYTHIFNKVREERQGQAAKAPVNTNDKKHINSSKKDDDQASTGCSCFGLFK